MKVTLLLTAAVYRRTLFKVASTFLNLSETMADFGFLVRKPPSGEPWSAAAVHRARKACP